MIPRFEDKGQPDRLMPKGVHEATESEVYECLVAPFPGSSTRAEIFARWSAFRVKVREFVDVSEEFMDGSFVTTRENPADVDLSFWIKAENVDVLSPQRFDALLRLGAQGKPSFMCDAYFVFECGQDHPAWSHFNHVRTWTRDYWRKYSDPDKQVVPGVTKGYLRIV